MYNQDEKSLRSLGAKKLAKMMTMSQAQSAYQQAIIEFQIEWIQNHAPEEHFKKFLNDLKDFSDGKKEDDGIAPKKKESMIWTPDQKDIVVPG